MDDCIIWDGKTCANGRYGRTSHGSKEFMAHRQAYTDAYGAIPEGMCVCHKCDIGLCVNPSHLFIGSASDNMKDAASKDRLPILLNQKGVNNSYAKYDKAFADSVRAFYEINKPSYSFLAKHFGIKSKGHAHAIVKRKLWV